MDDRVVEVTWDQRKESFQFLRMRDDRVEPNTLETVLAVLYVYEAQITANSVGQPVKLLRTAYINC